MADTKWLEIAVNTTPDKLDEVCAKLAAAGMDGLVIEDEGEFLQFLEQNRQYWDYVDQELLDRMRGITRVKFYVTDDADGHAQLERYTHGLGFEHTVTPLSDNDWAYSWQKYYKPLSIGQRLYVVPRVGAGQARARGPQPPVFEPRPHLRHRLPRLHPAVSGGGGGPHRPRQVRPGPGLRQRHPLHCRPVPGGQPGRGRGHRPQGGGCGL